jgi:AcrR family transcriptional regulator
VRQLVVDAATTLFAERGYARVATRDIARYADVTPSQLFAHFGTKARLFEIACVEPYVVAVSGFADRWRDQPALSDQLYTTLLNELFDVIGARPGLMTALIIAQAHEESLVEEIAPSLRPVDEALRPLEQMVRDPDSDSPVLAVRLTHGAVVAATQFQPWLTGHLTDRDTTVTAMTDLLRNGVGPLGPPSPGPAVDPVPDPATGEGMRPRLLDAAAELFRQRGFPGVSTRSIAAAAGTSETILFRHFPTKTALFEQAISEPWSRAAAAFLARTADSDLTALIGELYRLFHRHRPALLSLLEFERQSEAPTATPASITALTDHVRRRLPADRANASGIAGVIVAAVLGAAALDVWLFTGRIPSGKLVVAGLVDLVHSGFPLR